MGARNKRARDVRPDRGSCERETGSSNVSDVFFPTPTFFFSLPPFSSASFCSKTFVLDCSRALRLFLLSILLYLSLYIIAVPGRALVSRIPNTKVR